MSKRESLDFPQTQTIQIRGGICTATNKRTEWNVAQQKRISDLSNNNEKITLIFSDAADHTRKREQWLGAECRPLGGKLTGRARVTREAKKRSRKIRWGGGHVRSFRSFGDIPKGDRRHREKGPPSLSQADSAS